MITLNEVTFGYKKQERVLEGVNLNLSGGHIYGLLGKNGAGKSTILKLISGVIFPQRGSTITLDSDARKRLPSVMTRLFYLTEEIFSTSMTMNEYIRFASPLYSNFDRDEFYAHMEEFGVECDKKVSTMSLGQKKKASIAFALACNTSILLMDEPTNGLDIPSKSQFRRVISRAATEDRCIIISTHQVRDLDNLIDTIIILDEHKIIMNASTDLIEQKLLFKAISPNDAAIYREGEGSLTIGVVENTEGEESRIDIELLFNATTHNPQTINSILTNH